MLRIKWISVFLLMGFLVNTMANPKFSDPNKSISVTKAQPAFSVTLKSNRTTGYMWLLTLYNTDLINPVSQKYYAPKKGMMGAPGYEVWNFKVKPLGFTVPQVIEIGLVYARPWELNKTESIIFKVVTRNSSGD